MRKPEQHALHCRCGKASILAQGICAVCYTLKRQDQEYFGGLREKVLEREGYRCVSVTPPAVTSASSSFTIGCQGSPFSL